jgi:alpha-beta hydrolase superfamily lysophospholipase
MRDFNHLRKSLSPVLFDPAQDPPLADATGYCQHYGLDTLPGPHRMGSFIYERYQLAVQYWLPPQARQTVLIVHGYYDHIGLYRHLLAHLLDRGYAVLGLDLPGHGLSSGERASIPDFDVYGRTIAALCTAAEGRLPPITCAIGQSTGCAALTNSLMTGHTLPIQQLVLLAPLLRPHRWATHGRWLYTALHRLISRMPRNFSENSHDAAFVDFCRHHDPLQTRHLSVQWVTAMKHWLDRFHAQSPITLPTLVVQGQADTTVDWRYNIPALMSKLPNGQLEYLPDARHHLVNESEDIRQALWQILDTFLVPAC